MDNTDGDKRIGLYLVQAHKTNDKMRRTQTDRAEANKMDSNVSNEQHERERLRRTGDVEGFKRHETF